MGFSSLCLTFVSMYILSKFVLLQSYTTTCHDDEISALLQFKQSFVINKSASWYEGAYPKMASWNSAGNQTNNCCSWDGVECDEKTGHVVGLDLNSSCLYGSINSNNSLFHLAHLQSLNLADNDFNYSQVPTSIRNFPRLSFSGEFPFEYIFSGNGTTSFTHDLEYYYTDPVLGRYYSFTITSKGVERFYPKIQQDLVLIDISINNFEGQIPEFIGKLERLWSLNISGNNLTGRIPSSLGNLTRLESLDLSQNKFSGTIPQQLAQLDFLTNFNVSYNNLTGHVPRGIHFTTFDNTSYEGNPGLCGDPLSKKCENPEGTQHPPSTVEENDRGNGIELDWKFVWAGLGSGFLVGVVLADFVITKWNVLFIEIVAVPIRLTKRMGRPRY